MPYKPACVSYDNCPVQVGPPLVYFTCKHNVQIRMRSENLGDTGGLAPPTKGWTWTWRWTWIGGPKSATRRKAGTIRCRSQAKSSEQPNPLSIDPSALDMRGNLFSPLPNSIRGARDDRCWWEAFQGVGEGVNTVTRASKEGKALINSCVCCYSCVSCTAQLSVRDTKAPNEGSSRSDLPLLRASVFFFSEDEL